MSKSGIIKSMELSWVTVKNYENSKRFFEEKLGLELEEAADEHGWLELRGEDGGMILGVAQAQDHGPEAGTNAIVSMTVENIEEAIAEFKKRGVKFIDEMVEIPGHVKMITFIDPDGNNFQLVEKLDV